MSSAITNSGINQVLFQQGLLNSHSDNKSDSGQMPKKTDESVIVDIADISSSRWTKIPSDDGSLNVLKKATYDSTEGNYSDKPDLAVQEAVIQEKQNQLEIQASTENVGALQSFIQKDQSTAIRQQANQSAQKIIALIQ